MAKTTATVWNRFGPHLARVLAKLDRAVHTPILGGPGIKVEHVGDRVAISLAHATPVPTKTVVRRFRVKSEQADYIVCRTWLPAANAGAGTEGGVDVKVAKPFLLRRTPFDGEAITYPGAQVITYTYTQNYERTADDTVDSETQTMTPRYFVNEEILAARGIAGGSGVDISGYLAWVDLNAGARHWAAS